MNPDDMDTVDLRRFHKFIGSLICEREAHDWDPVPPEHGGPVLNTGQLENCRRCGATRCRELLANNTNRLAVTSREVRIDES